MARRGDEAEHSGSFFMKVKECHSLKQAHDSVRGRYPSFVLYSKI